VFIPDRYVLRKLLESAWINAGREVIALIASFGVFAAVHRTVSPGAPVVSADALPAIAIFVLVQFFFSRAMLYFSLLLREKLLEEEKALLLRYEVISLGAGAAGSSPSRARGHRTMDRTSSPRSTSRCAGSRSR
jgi:hypothetical protein